MATVSATVAMATVTVATAVSAVPVLAMATAVSVSTVTVLPVATVCAVSAPTAVVSRRVRVMRLVGVVTPVAVVVPTVVATVVLDVVAAIAAVVFGAVAALVVAGVGQLEPVRVGVQVELCRPRAPVTQILGVGQLDQLGGARGVDQRIAGVAERRERDGSVFRIVYGGFRKKWLDHQVAEHECAREYAHNPGARLRAARPVRGCCGPIGRTVPTQPMSHRSTPQSGNECSVRSATHRKRPF